jgi:ABC-2 type transport system permease protein
MESGGRMLYGIDLLRPSLIAFRRSLKTRSRVLLTVLTLGAAIFVFLVYFGLFKFLTHVSRAPMLGPVLGPFIGGLLVNKFQEMIFVALFFMVFFSSIISSFSAFFLDPEITLLFSSPVSTARIFWSRFLLMSTDSSWMALAFFLPVFFAFATTAGAPWWAYLVFPFYIFLYLSLPNIVGSFLALMLATFFPIRQMKKVFQFLSVVIMGSMIFFFRFLEPEKLLNPKFFGDVSRYILMLRNPVMEYFPSYWMMEATRGLFAGEFFLSLKWLSGLMVMAALGFFILWVLSRAFYRDSWQISMEAIENQVMSLEWLRKALLLPLRFFSRDFQVVAAKEITVFLRDPAIFSQLFMMGAIVFVYGYNLKIIPLKEIPVLYSGEVNDSLVYFNGPFIGFILAAISMRFVFPSISLEGKAFWAVKASPIRPARLVAIKFMLYLPVIMLLGVILCYISNQVFQVTSPVLLLISFLNVILMAFVITALAIGLGSVYAEYGSDNPLKVAGSFGGFVFMIFSALYVINLLICQAYPMYRFYLFRNYAYIPTKVWGFIGISVTLLLVSTCAWIVIPLVKGREALEQYEPD